MIDDPRTLWPAVFTKADIEKRLVELRKRDSFVVQYQGPPFIPCPICGAGLDVAHRSQPKKLECSNANCRRESPPIIRGEW